MRTFYRSLLVGLLLMAWQVFPSAGTPQLPRPQPKPDPSLTLQRVTITGPRNKPLPRLGPEHLKITEDGVEQKIEYLSFDSEPPSVAIVWGIQNDSLSNEARFVPPAFLDAIAKGAPPRGRGSVNPPFEYFLLEGGIETNSPPTVRIAFSTDAKSLPRIFPKVSGSLDAVYVGLDVLKEAAFSKKALLMIADTVDTTLQIEHYKQFAIRQGVPVFYIVAGGTGEGLLQLQELTDVSGGEGYFALSGGSIEAYALEVAQGLNNQYVVGYRPTNAAKNGKWRKLGVRVVNPPDGASKLNARTKSGYYVPRQDP
jgi:Ca-activated chloride channel family protein